MGRRAVGALLPKSFLEAVAVLGFDFNPEKDPISFSFHRQRRDGVWGWATFLHVGRLTVCAPWIDGLPFPRRRADAEHWVAAFCGRIGIAPMLNVGQCGNPGRLPGARVARRRASLRVIQGGACRLTDHHANA
jgi:hypothetical protein